MIRKFCAAFAVSHLLLIIAVCSRDTFGVLKQGQTVSPSRLNGFWRDAEALTANALGQGLPKWNPLREGIKTYLNGAGIDAGYGFFAPNVPQAYKLIFELHYGDDHVEYEVPRVNSTASGIRMQRFWTRLEGSTTKLCAEGC